MPGKAKNIYSEHKVDGRSVLNESTLNEIRDYLFEVHDCYIVPGHNMTAIRDQGQQLGAIKAAMQDEPLL